MDKKNKKVQNISNYLRLLSYLYPVLINESEGDHKVKLYLIRNQFVLSTDDTTYSDGDRYLPARAITHELKAFLPDVKKVLVLGAGLGSMVRVLHKKGFYPSFTLVEKDSTILQWAMDIFDSEKLEDVNGVCDDAVNYIEHNTEKYDLIFVDVFIGREVPGFVTSETFLKLCHKNLAPRGRMAVNYMVINHSAWEDVKKRFTRIFRNHKELDLGENRILMAK